MKRVAGGGRLTWRFAAIVGAMVLVTTIGPADVVRAQSVADCVAKRMADGETRPKALAACLSETAGDPDPGGGLEPSNPSSGSESDRTSPLLLTIVGLGGLAIGAAGATLVGRRTRRAAPSTPGAVPATPTQVPAPPMPAPPSADRTQGLVAALIDLSDRMSSQALRAEIIATLDRAGVQAVDVAVGEPFDATRMRGVSGAPTTDASWVGRVAGTDRCGFRDGARIIRLPDVVVYTTG
ncbi:MAG: hypothetical protein AAB131_20945 [Actinomycetota bacterium]